MKKNDLLKIIKEKYLNDSLELLNESIKIPSYTNNPEANKPYGKDSDFILDKYLDLSKSWGANKIYKDPEGYFGFADFGESEKIMGIFCHLDVVSPGNLELWTNNPFEPTIKGDYLYGRGSNDTKGPNVGVIYALKYLLDSKYDFKGITIRLFFGLNEEGKFECIFKYLKEFGQPQIGGITSEPANSVVLQFKGKEAFKLICSEKQNDFSINGGNDYNMVLDVLNIDFYNEELFEKYINNLNDSDKKFKINVEQKKVTIFGKPSHGSLPEYGLNAANVACKIFEAINYKENNLINFINDFFGMKNYLDDEGDVEYKTGRPTVNLGFINTVDGVITAGFDTRFPPEVDKLSMYNNIINNSEKYGLSVINEFSIPSVNLEKNQLSDKLLDVIKKYTLHDSNEYVYSTGVSYSNIIENNYTICAAEDFMKAEKKFGYYLPHSYDERFYITKYETVIASYVEIIQTFIELN